MRPTPVKTAVIGCGMISDIYLKNLTERFSIIDLVGVADIVPEKAAAQAEKYGVRVMTNDEIFADPEIELVLNLTYASAHFAVSRAILSAGKHCYSEKMMCLTLAEADELCRIARERGVMFAVAPDTFLGAAQQTARMIVDRGLIGEPIQAVVNLARGYHMIKSSEDDARRKYSVMEAGGGIPYDMGGYYLHQLFNLAGPVESVCGYMMTRQPSRLYLNPRHDRFGEDFTVTTPNTVCASMRFRSGLLCSFNLCSEYLAHAEQFELRGREGILYLGDPNNFGDKVYLQRGKEKLEFPLCHPYATNSRGVGAAEMAWSLRQGRAPRLSMAMGYHALEVICGIAESAETGRRVEFATDFARPAPIDSLHYSGASEERSIS